MINTEFVLTHAQLVDPEAFHDWASRLLVSAENIEDLCDQIARDSSAEASLRCVFLAIQVHRWDLVNRYLLDARLSNGLPDDVAVAITVLESRRELAMSRLEDRVSSVDGPANVIGTLLEARKRLQLFPKRRLFTLEQEFFCLVALANVYHKRREWDTSLAILSEALGLAKTLSVPSLVTQAHGLIINSLTHAGRFSEASEENERILAASSDQRLLSSNFQSNSEIRFRFGAFEEAVRILQSIDMPAESKRNAFDFFDLLRGRFDPSRTPEGRPKFEAIRQGLRELIVVNGICPSVSNEASFIRSAHSIAQLFPKETEFPGSVERALSIFLKTKARLLTHDYALSTTISSQYRCLDVEPDIFAALIASLRLEICLQVYTLDYLSIQESLHDLELIVESFDRQSFSSSVGLAQFLGYWTPLAAAFLAVLPNANTHFVAASRAILKIESAGTFAYTVQIPNKYASEQVLTAHDISLRRNSIPAPNLNARETPQRDALKIMNGTAPYWRPVLSIGPIAFGLMRLSRETGNEEYARHARSLFQQFGLFPKSKTDFAEHLQNAIVDAYNRLFNRFTTLEGFVDEIVRLRL